VCSGMWGKGKQDAFIEGEWGRSLLYKGGVHPDPFHDTSQSSSHLPHAVKSRSLYSSGEMQSIWVWIRADRAAKTSGPTT
jgi:hypothetical protein